MSGEESGAGKDKSVPALGSELLGLVIGYARQETIDPLRSLARFVAWGVAGAVLLSAGGVLLALAAVRAAQAESGAHLHGNLTWVPYAGGVTLAMVGAIWSVSRIFKGTGSE